MRLSKYNLVKVFERLTDVVLFVILKKMIVFVAVVCLSVGFALKICVLHP